MVEKINQPIFRNKRSIKIEINVHNSFSITPYVQQSITIQNNIHLRSEKYQEITNHFKTSYSFSGEQPNSNRLNMRSRANINNQQNYCRYRNATYYTQRKTCTDHFLFPCYSKLTNQNENEYSRYRDSRSPSQNSINGYDNIDLKPHKICRSLAYDRDTMRFPVPDEKVFWNKRFPEYSPIEYTTKKIKSNRKADPSDPSKITKFNQIDKKIDRRSFTGHYHLDPITNRPLNPIGRTGITGRGRLYYWGPNHAGDPVVTRWLRDENDDSIIYRRNNSHGHLKPVLEFVAIQRHDTKQWALPGGMVDPGENVSETIKREFQEEAMRNGIDKNSIDKLFSNGYKLYESYVDDPRNTDNAWIETVAIHFHDETGQLTKNLHLHAGDDAEKVVWCPIDQKLELYACHKDIIKKVVDRLDAYW